MSRQWRGFNLSTLGLPGTANESARESMGGALQAASQLPDAVGAQVVATASTAFTNALSSVMLVRIDPRVEQSRRIIGEAALADFAERGFEGMTIEGVAARAGVGKSTTYRHWRSKLELLDDALRLLPTPQREASDVPIIDRVTQYVVDLEEVLDTHPWGSLLPAMVQAAEKFDDVARIQRQFGAERRAVLARILLEAVDDGELAPVIDIDLTARCLVAPIFLATSRGR